MSINTWFFEVTERGGGPGHVKVTSNSFNNAKNHISRLYGESCIKSSSSINQVNPKYQKLLKSIELD